MNRVYSLPLRSTGTAYLFWLFLGTFGGHQFYLGRPLRGILYICTLGLLGMGVLWDLFTLPSQVRQANEKTMRLDEERDDRRRELEDKIAARRVAREEKKQKKLEEKKKHMSRWRRVPQD